MFDFLSEWDERLFSFERDIELSIKYNGNSWVTNSQFFCERVMKLYNNEVRCFGPSRQLTLGYFLSDAFFCADYQKRTTFNQWESLSMLNRLSNDIKHNGNIPVVSEKDITDIMWSIHSLAVKTYNYLMHKTLNEKFDDNYFRELKESQDNDINDIVTYADLQLARKNEEIASLLDDLSIMDSFAKEDQKINKKMEAENNVLKSNNRMYGIMFEQLLSAAKVAVESKDENDLADLIYFFNQKPSNMPWDVFFKRKKDLLEKESAHFNDYEQEIRMMSNGVDNMSEEDYLAEFPDAYLDGAYNDEVHDDEAYDDEEW